MKFTFPSRKQSFFSNLRHLQLIPFFWSIPGEAVVLPEVRMTEFLALNDEGIRDEDGNRSDWIEIWNASGISGHLGGWYLTDDPSVPTKWQFPEKNLKANERILVFASNKDRSAAQGELHTNFKISSAAGGYLALVRPDGVTVASEFANYPAQAPDRSFGVSFPIMIRQEILSEGSATRWLVPAAEIAGWREQDFDDGSWSSGTTGIGYDSTPDYRPHLGAGDDLQAAMQNVNASVFIRVPFSYTPQPGIARLLLRMKWEDGFAAFLNGQEITRQRAPKDLVWNATSNPASGRNESDAVKYDDYPVQSADLRDGENILAIHGLNQSVGSSDLLISPLLEVEKVNLDQGRQGYFGEPTPAEANETAQYNGLVAGPVFSVERGSFEEPFTLELSSNTPEAAIRYTLDGSRPSESQGQLYKGPITISATTVVRALAYRKDHFPTKVETQTYLFPADVVGQPEMRTAITSHPEWGPKMLASLGALPSLALTFDGDDINRTELPVSVELLDFENGGHQIEAGAVRVGGFFTDYDKHSIRLHFRSRWGPRRLKYPVFANRIDEVPAVDTYDALDVRAGNQDMVHRGAYLSNIFADDSMLEMGQPAPRGRFVHLYFNGNYRGMYHLRERFHAAMISDYEAGPEEEYTTVDAVNRGNFFSSGIIQTGDGQDWNQILSDLQGANRYEKVKTRLNVENLIDFMLLWTSGSCESEFRAVGSPQNGFPFVFHMKDADGFLRPPDLVDNDPRNRTFAYVHLVTHPGPADAMLRLRAEGHPEFKMLLADRIHRHFFNDGALTPHRHIARLERLVEQARLPYLAEAARWGFHDGTPNRNPAQWEAYQQDLLQNQFPTLAAGQVAKLKAAGMYPEVAAPVFSQHGGALSSGEGVVMAGSSDLIYYTLDGSDPRDVGGSPASSAIVATWDMNQSGPQDFLETGTIWRYLADGSDQGQVWREPNFDDRSWLEGPSELGYGEGDEATVVGFIDTDAHTPGIQRNATTYFRTEFLIEEPSDFSAFTFSMKFDDGLAVFLNGEEVLRDNLAPDATFDVFAEGHNLDEETYFNYQVPSSRFVPGRNVLAVEVHNAFASSGDLSFDLRLRGEAPAGDLRRTEELIPDGPVVLKARSYDVSLQEWSALNEAFFYGYSVPPSSTNLTISEIHYHPAKPTSADELAISDDPDDYEFIELLNLGSAPLSLAGLSFTDGISFTFPPHSWLGAGARLVLVGNLEAFRARYGEESLAFVGGEYEGRLSNRGERLELSSQGDVLFAFSYSDRGRWPRSADGGGGSLVLIDPEKSPDLSNGFNWRVHPQWGGGPGVPDDPSDYETWKAQNGFHSDLEDRDGDGLSTLLEYLLGSSPTLFSPEALPALEFDSIGNEKFPVMVANIRSGLESVSWEFQSSKDLQTWNKEDFIEIAPGRHQRQNALAPDEPAQFYRLKIWRKNDD